MSGWIADFLNFIINIVKKDYIIVCHFLISALISMNVNVKLSHSEVGFKYYIHCYLDSLRHKNSVHINQFEK